MTRIADLLAKGRTYSFEFFPPKTDAEQATLVRTLRDLEPLGPSFVSVTYRGGAESRQRTFDLVTGMLRTTTLVPMAHLICVAHTRLELAEILVAYRMAGVENLMALGGDPPAEPGRGARRAPPRLRAGRAGPGHRWLLGRGGRPARLATRCPPTWTPTATTWPPSCRAADFAVTQFFFEAAEYTDLVADLAARGVDKPVLPGIMPVTSLRRCPGWPPWARRCRVDGGAPRARPMSEAGPTPSATRVWRSPPSSASSCWHAGVPGLHFYTLNRSSATREIYAALGASGCDPVTA